MTVILAIDTSTDQGSVALTNGELTQAEVSWTVRGNHSRHLSQVIDRLLGLEGLPPSRVEAVVVARGPGSFSGLRVAISEGKGLAMALEVPLIGVSTLDVIGFQACHAADRVRAFVAAGRGDLFTAAYAGEPDTWRRVDDHRIVSAEQGAALLDDAEVAAGPGATIVQDVIARSGRVVNLEPPAMRLRRAAFLAELGRQYLESGHGDEIDTLEPLYLRQSAAEEKRDGHKG